MVRLDTAIERRLHPSAVGSVALLLAFGSCLYAAGSDERLYVERKPVDIKVGPRTLVGQHMKIKDYFGRALDPKDKDDKKLWRRQWVKDQKIRPRQYLVFFTDSDRLGSAMLCYVPRSDKAAVDLIEERLQEKDPIVLTGQLMARELGDGDEPDITHFMVASVQRGHGDARAFYVATDKGRKPITRAGEYEFACPMCGKKSFSLRFHEPMGSFDLTITCPHPNCGCVQTYRFTME